MSPVPFRHPRRTGLLLAVFALAALPVHPAAPPPDDAAVRIDAYLQPFIDAAHLSGYLLVARGGRVVYERAMGRANYELDVPVGPETRFCVASVNKPMTLVVAIRLLEEGKLGLQDPVAKWLPGFPQGDKMTVEHLLRHRAGIPHRLVGEEERDRPWSPAELVEKARQGGLAFTPGGPRSYSSGGFSVLARVLELAGGRSYEELLEEYLLRPAGMSHTAHGSQQPLMPGRAASYYFGPDGGLVNAPPRDLSYLVGAGAVYSTARDLLAMMRAVVDGRLGESVRASLLDDNGVDWNGLTHGFRAFADYHRESDTYIVLTANVQSGAGDHLRANLPRILAGEQPAAAPELPRLAATVAPELLRRYEGLYELRPGRTMPLRVEGGALRIEEWLLVPTSETSFFSPQDYGRVRVVLGDGGAVERLDWTAGGQTFPMPRVGDLPAAP